MFCRNCGSQLNDNALVCEKCGAPVYNAQPEQAQPSAQAQSPYQQQYQSTYSQAPQYQQYASNQQYYQRPNNDSTSIGWFFLGLFVPLVGLILFVVWRNERPIASKRAGIGALIGFIAAVFIPIALIILFATRVVVSETEFQQWYDEIALYAASFWGTL